MQTDNIFKWFGDDNKILYLTMESINKCYINDKLSSFFKSLCVVNWKKTNYQINCMINKSIEKKIILHKSPIITNKKNASVLKSILQKAVRRKLSNLSVKVSLQMINDGLISDLLRRLTIIIIEDSMLTKYYPTLMFLLVTTTKGYILTKYTIDWILGFVEHLCNNFNFLDYYEKYDFVPSINYVIKNTKSKTIMLMVLFRKSYGCMSGEERLINNCIITWINRFNKNDFMFNIFINEPSFCLVDSNKIEKLNNTDIIVEGIDFHCCPNILEKLSINDERMTESAIWYCRSSINHRTKISLKHYIDNKKQIDKYKDTYDKIKDELDAMCINIIKNIRL
jgi:hypothetical protein